MVSIILQKRVPKKNVKIKLYFSSKYCNDTKKITIEKDKNLKRAMIRLHLKDQALYSLRIDRSGTFLKSSTFTYCIYPEVDEHEQSL